MFVLLCTPRERLLRIVDRLEGVWSTDRAYCCPLGSFNLSAEQRGRKVSCMKSFLRKTVSGKISLDAWAASIVAPSIRLASTDAWSSSSASTTASPSNRNALYARLGVTASATSEDIKGAYRRRALECHPDVVPQQEKKKAEVEFRKVAEAYRTLSNARLRAEYDAEQAPLEQPPSTRKKKWSPGMVRRDADKVFHEVFDGMSIQDIIFGVRFTKKFGSSAQHPSSQQGEHVFREAQSVAQKVAEDLHSRHRWPDLHDVKLRARTFTVPKPPPSGHMSFRPFVGMKVPAGVTAEDVPPAPAPVPLGQEHEVQDITVTCKQSTPYFRPPQDPVEWVRQAQNSVQHGKHPHNEGVIYSYQRLF